MRLQSEEPDLGPWRAVTPADLLASLLDGAPEDRAAVIAVDGRGGSGKSTSARRLAQAAGGTVVATDDVAWNHSFFGWHDRLVEHVLRPVREGRGVDWRPVEWPDDKPGAIVVPPGTRLLVVEGVSAGARALGEWIDRLVWVQSDVDDAERRGIARDIAEGREPAEAKRFWDEWMAEELPVQARERAWDRADAVLLGGASSPDGPLLLSTSAGRSTDGSTGDRPTYC